MSGTPINILVLAGTAEARAVIEMLRNDPEIILTASLAGATPQPLALPVPTLSGGFGVPLAHFFQGLLDACLKPLIPFLACLMQT